MSATQAQSGFGTLFQLGDGETPTETFTTIAEVINITTPEKNLATVDATHMESPQGFMEDIPTLLSSGECTLDLNFLPSSSTQASLDTAMLARRKCNCRIILPGALKRFEFAGYVTKLGRAMPHDDKMTMSVTVKATGPTSLVDNT
ncbi:MAG: hypothetical protein EPN91_12570 [Salinibacterium sp.]|nr:MAG: hypothetical protein EPN91_12570 [Salinibacterium sp.]